MAGAESVFSPEFGRKSTLVSSLMMAALVALALVPCVSLRSAAIPLPVPKGTFPTAINKRGEVAGYCIDSIKVAHGFVRDARGRVTVFEAPEARSTFVSDISNAGLIVGYYIDAKRMHHGFLRNPNRAFTTLDAPGAGAEMGPAVIGHPELRSGQGTLATGVNDAGVITGYFIDAQNLRHGFIWDKLGGFTTFDVENSGGTEPQSISDSGKITGTYHKNPADARRHFYGAGDEHGFLRDSDGTITTFDSPGSGATQAQSVSKFGLVAGPHGREEVTACYPTRKDLAVSAPIDAMQLDIDRFRGPLCANLSGGMVVGNFYEEIFGTRRGFMRDGHGVVTTFDVSCEGTATAITSVTPLVAGVTDTISIKGRHFGSYGQSTDPNEGRIVINDLGPGRGCGEDPTPGKGGGGPLRVARWTDSEIEVTGFSWPSQRCPFHAGDQVSIDVWNAQTGAGPARYELTVAGTSKDLIPPHITSVTPVYPRGDQTIIIKGQGFGAHPTDLDSYLDIVNETGIWTARREFFPAPPGGFSYVDLRVGRWTDTEIEVTGFDGQYGRYAWTLNGGDQIKVEVWNAQTGAGPATYELTVVGAGQDLVAPSLTSVTPMTTRADQTIIIKGQGFGIHPPFVDQSTAYLLISDKTANWVAGRRYWNNTYTDVVLSVSRWTDAEIEVSGFSGAYGKGNRTLNAGDEIKVKVWNAQTGAGPATYELTAGGEGQDFQTCKRQGASGQLSLMITSLDQTAGFANVNGIDQRRPIATPFTWNWGDGSITQGWFPQSHVYANTKQNYVLQVISHEDDGSTDCARILIPLYRSRISESASSSADEGSAVSSATVTNKKAANEINVPGSQPWTDTGVDVKAGDLLSIDASGGIRFSVGGPLGGPDGDGVDCHHLGVEIHRWTFPDADLSCHSLIGRIRLSGPIFGVGSTARFRASGEGRLYLGVNDNFFPDNLGNWTAYVSLESGDTTASNSDGAPTITTTTVRVGAQPTGVAFDGAHLWVSNNSSNTVTKVQPKNGTVLGTFSTGSYPVGITFDGANIWVANYGFNGRGNTVTVLSAITGQPPFPPVTVSNGPRGVAFDGANVWVANSGLNAAGNTVTKLRASDGALLGTYTVGTSPECLAFDGANIWVTNRGDSSVTKLRASDGTVLGTFSVGNGPFGIAFDGAHIWVANGGGNVTELALNGYVLRTVAVGNGASGVAFDGANVWVASQNSHTVTKLQASNGKVLGTFSVSGNPWGVAFDGANVWVSNFTGSNIWKF